MLTELPNVILASASPRRVELLSSLGFHVDVRPTHLAEGDVPGLSPRELAAHHSAAKCDAALAALGADAAAAGDERRVVVTADTVVDLDGLALGKPSNSGESRAMLESLSGREHLVHTAIDIVVGARAARVAMTETTAVRFFALGEDLIGAYVASGDGLDKAGAYGIQGPGGALVERIDGDFYTVMGFPVGRFVHALAALGFAPPAFARRAADVAP